MSTSEIKARNGVSASGVISRDTYNHHALSKYDMGLEVGQPTITESKVQVAVYVQYEVMAQQRKCLIKLLKLGESCRVQISAAVGETPLEKRRFATYCSASREYS